MNIEEKAKAYDEALEKAKSKIKNDKDHVLYEDDIIEIFPVLAESEESEDERIRKAIKKALQVRCDGSRIISDEPVTLEEAIAWIEKQDFIKSIIAALSIFAEEKKANGCFDNEINWLKSIKERVLPQPKQEWSVESISTISRAISIVKWAAYSDHSHPILNDKGATELVERLNSLKERVQPQPKWSEEDERILVEILKIFNIEKFEGYNIGENNEDALKFLKSLKGRIKPQNTWKPSKEQIVALRWVLNNVHYNKHKEEISKLLDQIKDL